LATTYRHPGIYIEEVPSARNIQGASTSTAAFVGVTEFGPFAQPTLITSWNAYQRQFGGLVWYGMVSWAVFEFFNEGGTACYVVRAVDSKGNGKAATGSASGIKMTAVTPGTWANILNFAVSNASGPDSAVSLVFNLSVAVNTTSMFVRAETSGTTRPPNSGKSATPLAGGAAATWDFESATTTLSTVQGISLLAIPDTVNAADASGNPSQASQATSINGGLLFCEAAQNLFYVSDPPFGLDVQGIGNFKSGSATSPALNSSYGAIYYPWVWIYNPIAGANVPMPPSGPSLGRYAYTDNNVGVWKSPAGVNDGALLSVVQLQTQLTDSDQDILNPNGINAVRNFLNYGNVIWGARTLAANGSEWTYVSVRRLFIYVEQSLKQSLQWVVFEPNDQQTWASVTRDISAFLTTLWQSGGLFGASAAEAFFVTCDASNNPPETRSLGQLYIDVGLAPVFPAEFVIIRMTQKIAGPDSGS
jgi:phage tail sheath protein FI